MLPTIKEYQRRKGALPKVLTFSMAAFIAFYSGARKADGSMEGAREKDGAYPIADDDAVLAFFEGLQGRSAADTAHAVLQNADFWGEDLTALPGFEAAVSAALSDIREKGARAAIDALVR